MTESDWLAATDATALSWQPELGSRDRKRRLFECACCRRVWTELPDPRSRRAIEAAEQFADGEISDAELEAAANAGSEVWHEQMPSECADPALWMDYFYPLPFTAAAYNAAIPFGWWGGAPAFEPPSWIIRETHTEQATEATAQLQLLRDIFGNPFRPVTFEPRWQSETAVALAAGIYEERAFDRLPVLADALEEAGCDHPDILAHCRGDGPHVRGCWVIDLVLSKA